jgi:hypothetical protein
VNKINKKILLNGKPIHPALHIEPGFSSIGVNIGGTYWVLTPRANYKAEDIELAVPSIIHPELADRFKLGSSKNPKSLSEGVEMLTQKWRDVQWFQDERVYPTFSLWAAGTYVFEAFLTYPYLALPGEKGMGKTKVLDVLKGVAFNGLKLVIPSPAVLFRTVHSLRPTTLIDEAEKISDELRAIINVGYKKGATVGRCQADTYQPEFFEVYSPKAFANIAGLGDVTEDRCIVILMTKAPEDDDRRNKPVDQRDPIWTTIRDRFYRIPLDYADQIIQEQKALSLPPWLSARARELWSPLLTLGSIADKEGGSNLFNDVLGLAHDLTASKGLTFESDALVSLLERRLGTKDIIELHPHTLCFDLEQVLNRKGITAEWIAGRLRSLGFKKIGRNSSGVLYEITRDKIKDLR